MAASERIDRMIAELTDWRATTFASIRKTILAADREIIEEWKWMGSPVWSRDGIIAVANPHKGKVKVTFDYGARLPDPDKLFNAGLEGNQRRAIDFFEGDKVNERALKALVRAAIEFNRAKRRRRHRRPRRSEGPRHPVIRNLAALPVRLQAGGRRTLPTSLKPTEEAMAYQSIEVRKLTPSIGAEIFGVDLAKPLGNQQFQEVHDALMDNLVVFFRDQKMSIDQHKDFGRRFGPLHTHPNAPIEFKDHPEILVIKADEKSKHVAGEEWHSDVSCDVEPPMGSILYLTEVPPDGGDTLFANTYRAYETLSEPIKRMLQGLTALHDSSKAHYYRVKATHRTTSSFPTPSTPWCAPIR